MTSLYKVLAALVLVLLPLSARAQISEECTGVTMADDYDEQTQWDFMANYTGLATTYSAMHAPVPHRPGHGAIGLALSVLPPLSCEQRLVLAGTKTEDTNKTPVVPRPFLSFAMPAIGPMVLYGSVGWVPPVPILGTQNHILSGEFGAGFFITDKLTAGVRVSATVQKTVADAAGPFEGQEAKDDLYLGSTFGVDAMVGYSVLGGRVEEGGEPEKVELTPYAAVGFTDVSTFFYIGEDGIVGNNLHPYAGLTFSVGLDGLVWGRFRWGAEFYGAPGGYSSPDPDAENLAPASRYGHLYTGRIRLGVEI